MKRIVEPTTSFETKTSVKSALDKLKANTADSAPVIDEEGKLLGKVSKQQVIRDVPGRGDDPKMSPVEPEVEKEGEPYCYKAPTIIATNRL